MVQTDSKIRKLTEKDQAIIGQLLVETLAGKISPKTRDAVYELGIPSELPDPYQHLISYAQGYALDNKSLARALQEELRGICVELLDPNYPE